MCDNIILSYNTQVILFGIHSTTFEDNRNICSLINIWNWWAKSEGLGLCLKKYWHLGHRDKCDGKEFSECLWQMMVYGAQWYFGLN